MIGIGGASEFLAPGNPIGIGMIGSGVGQLGGGAIGGDKGQGIGGMLGGVTGGLAGLSGAFSPSVADSAGNVTQPFSDLNPSQPAGTGAAPQSSLDKLLANPQTLSMLQPLMSLFNGQQGQQGQQQPQSQMKAPTPGPMISPSGPPQSVVPSKPPGGESQGGNSTSALMAFLKAQGMLS